MVSVQQERNERLLAARTADIKAKTAKDISDYFSKVFRTIDPARLAYAGMAAAEANLPERSEAAAISRGKAMSILKDSGQETLLGSFMLDYRRAEELRYNDAEPDEVEPLYIQLKERLVKYSGTRNPIYIAHLWNMAEYYNAIGRVNDAEATVEKIRKTVKDLTYVRSAAINVNSLQRYAEVLARFDPSKALIAANEAMTYAQERPVVNRPFIEPLEKLLASLRSDTAQ